MEQVIALAAVAGGWAGYLVLQFFRGDYSD